MCTSTSFVSLYNQPAQPTVSTVSTSRPVSITRATETSQHAAASFARNLKPKLKTHHLDSTRSAFVRHRSKQCGTADVPVCHQPAALCSCPALAYLRPGTQSLRPQNQSKTPAPVSWPSPPVESLGDGIRPGWVKEPLSTGPLTCISSPTAPHQKGRRRGRQI